MAGSARTIATYMLTAAEIGRYCGATALTFNMHVCSCLWTGALADDLEMSAAERRQHERAPRAPLRADRRGGHGLRPAVLRGRRGGGRRGAVRDQGRHASTAAGG